MGWSGLLKMQMRGLGADLELRLLPYYRRLLRDLRSFGRQNHLTRGVLLNGSPPAMNIVDLRSRLIGPVAILMALGMIPLGPEPPVRSPISADDFVRAMVTHRPSLIEFYLREHFDPDARWSQGCPLILVAALQHDWAN